MPVNNRRLTKKMRKIRKGGWNLSLWTRAQTCWNSLRRTSRNLVLSWLKHMIAMFSNRGNFSIVIPQIVDISDFMWWRKIATQTKPSSHFNRKHLKYKRSRIKRPLWSSRSHPVQVGEESMLWGHFTWRNSWMLELNLIMRRWPTKMRGKNRKY